MAILLRLTFAALVLLVVEYSGFWVWLISHPWWSLSSTLNGIIGGVIVSLAAIWARRTFGLNFILVLAVSLVALAIAYAATAWGKNGFAVSYAEDVFAGKVWFFGLSHEFVFVHKFGAGMARAALGYFENLVA